VDVSQPCIEIARAAGFNAIRSSLTGRLPFDDGSFDAIYSFQVLEHCKDPIALLRELSRLLRQGGPLYLAVPNFHSAWKSLFRSNWIAGWFAPFHLFHFSDKTFSILAGASGFIVSNTRSATPESWFRLNVRAMAKRGARLVESDPQSTRVGMAKRALVGAFLRVVELPFRHRDCLIVELRKQ
jgi:SAM-dependent methyltransferase